MQSLLVSSLQLPARGCAWRAQPVSQVRHVPTSRVLSQRTPRRQHLANATDSTTPQGPSQTEDDYEVELLPEEDWEVPGTYEDAMKAGTKLGKAVASACDELETLGSLETEVLNEAQKLLQQVGFKGSLFDAPKPAQPDVDPAAETGAAP